MRFFVISVVVLSFGFPAFAQSNEATPKTPPAAPPVVLELFTSQSCGFCPPADALIGQMAQQESIIALSCHVDYFGGPNNSLGQSFCTRRQNEYNRIIGTGPRYTPQLVVNGHKDMIGYQTGKVSAAVIKARAEKVHPISITDAGAGVYSFSLPAIDVKYQEIRLWSAVYDIPQDLPVLAGNNFGKKQTYFNVVSKISDIGAWDGRAMTQNLTQTLSDKNAGFAIIAQNVKTGHIVAAGDVKKVPQPKL